MQNLKLKLKALYIRLRLDKYGKVFLPFCAVIILMFLSPILSSDIVKWGIFGIGVLTLGWLLFSMD